MHNPAFWLACAFAGGIFVCAQFPVRPAIPAAACAFAAAAAGVRIRNDRAATAATFAAVFFAGVCAYALKERCLDACDLNALLGGRSAFLSLRGTVRRAPVWERRPDERGEAHWRGTGEVCVSAVETARGWTGLSGIVRAAWRSGEPIALGCGDRVTLHGVLRPIDGASNPGQFDARTFWRRRGIGYILSVSPGGTRITDRAGRRRIAGLLDALRRELSRRLAAGMPPGAPARVVQAMLLGVREGLGDEISRPFGRTNTMHILAISGLHVGFFYLSVRAALDVLRVPRHLSSAVAIPLIALYAVVTGGAVPVLRASVMFIALLIAPFLRRQRDPVNALGVAGIVILAANPLQLFDTGFRLSFAAVLSILVFSGPLAAFFHRLWPCRPLQGQLLVSRGERVRWWTGRQAISLLAASLATWIGLAPLFAASFHIVTALGLLGNLLVIPAGLAVVCLGFAGLLATCISTALAGLLHRLAWCVAWAMLGGVDAISRLPWAWRHVRSPGPLLLCAYYGTAVAGLLVLKGSARGRWKALLLSAMTLFPLLPPALGRVPPELRITFLDVGQGDAICIEFPRGETLLVDAGPGAGGSAGRRVVAPFLKSRGRSRVDTALLTHAHDDHFGGFAAVFDEFPTARTVAGRGTGGRPPPPFAVAPDDAGGEGFYEVKRGDLIARGDGASVTVLHPGGALCPETQADLNNGSVALMVAFGRTRALLCGDLEREGEEELRRSGLSLKADLLKVGHHGGASSCTEEFLREVAPTWAVVSAGRRNRFGHPSPKTLARLREAGIIVYRTDLHGAVTFVSDGERWAADTFR